ncbi:mechanosensitive ion channel protein [Litorimonas cladophorae]|uniref:Small-conductance mechanosensitive channel n=1 Tax=Litorimonas cladophorae TaxID=1220491 RepID=A0A918KAS1_9PROT|nr:mechanosensitive ion channel domain-containing protein [Litorimonas cladophorae]GGX56927.1 mechanosensitive ion channel protein [Litorimonas cladophorae]
MADDVVSEVADAAETAKEFLSLDTLVAYGQTALPYVLKFLTAFVVVWIGFKIARWAGKVAKKSLLKAPNVDETLAQFLGSMVRYAIMTVVGVVAIGQVGVQTASLVALVGAAGLAIGLALQGTLSNIAAGVMLMLFRPYKLGDFVKLVGEEGVVTAMTIFTTELATVDNKHVIIGNGDVWGSTIQNYSSKGTRRVDNDFGIDYEDDINKAMDIVTKTAATHPKVHADPAPWVKVVGLGESSVDLQSRVWTDSDDYWDVMFDLNKAVKEAFDAGGITIPYPISVELDSK